jgi:hypothetical protein
MLSVLRFTDPDYPFGVFKLSLEKREGVIKNGQSRNTDNIEHTRHKLKTSEITQYNTENEKNKEHGPHKKKQQKQTNKQKQKPRDKLRCSGMVSSFCFLSDTRQFYSYTQDMHRFTFKNRTR